MTSLLQRYLPTNLEQPNHLEYLDALRGYAFLGVLAAHFSHDFSIKVPSFLRFVGYGVTLFYVLSAFCLMLSLHRRETSPDWKNYCIRRFFRIAPAFYTAILLWALFNLWRQQPLDPGKILASMAFLNGFFPDYIHSSIPHGWSVAIETSFYVILPFLFIFIRNTATAILFLAVATPVCLAISWGLPLIAATAYSNPNHLAEYTVYWLPAQIPVFLIGICTYFIVYSRSTFSAYIVRLIHQHNHITIGLLFFIAAGSGYLPPRLIHLPIAFGCALWIIWLSEKPKSLCCNRAIAKIGVVSFSAYLFHQFALEFAKFLSPGKDSFTQIIASFSFTLLSSLIFAAVGYKFIEKPGISLGSYIISRQK